MLPAIARLDKDSIPSNPNASDSHTESEKSSSSNGARQVDQRGALPRCIILAPTRELASQIHMDCRRVLYGSDMKAITVYGGNDLRAQLQELAQGCDIVVATPGRLNDLVERGCVSLANVSVLILDEADRMLDMGFEVREF